MPYSLLQPTQLTAHGFNHITIALLKPTQLTVAQRHEVPCLRNKNKGV